MYKEKNELDLFDHHELIPADVRAVMDKYATEYEDGADYQLNERLLADLKPLGYTFDYYLDAEPYNLRKIDQVKNYQVFEAETWKVNPQLFNLAEAKEEIAHCSPFGIVNVTTGKIVVFHTTRGFFFPYAMTQKFPGHCERIIRAHANFNYHPKQN